MMDMVIEGVLDLPLTSQCQDALAKMSYCSQCAGYSSDISPCKSLCVNTMRGCLVDLINLVPPFREATVALVRVKNLLEYRYNIWDQIALLNSYFFTTVTQAQTTSAGQEFQSNVCTGYE